MSGTEEDRLLTWDFSIQEFLADANLPNTVAPDAVSNPSPRGW